MKISIIYPCDFFNKQSVEPDYAAEFIESCKLNFNIIFLDYEELVNNGNLKIYPNIPEVGLGIYRGWMLKPEQYTKFYNFLKSNGLYLLNTHEQYCCCHEFPNSYSVLAKITPSILAFSQGSVVDWETAKKEFSRFMIKDFVKSVKGNIFPKYFDSSYSNHQLDEYLEKFIAFRGDLYTGGIVLKKYVQLATIDGKTNEYRAFYLKGKLISLSKNSNQKDTANQVPMTFVNCVPKLKSNFYTVDFAELENGDWIVIEVGDGQVSGLSPNQYIFKFYEEIDFLLNQ